jgi:signal transduction histidine kinase
LFILGSLLFYQNRNRKKTNEKLQVLNSELDQANTTKVKFLSILNHDLRSPVYNFIHFMQLQKESPELLDTETKKTIETKTIASAENLLGSMEDLLLWSKGQMNNFEPQPKTIAISSLFEDARKHFGSEEKVQLTFENSDNIEINTDENFINTIIRNLTGNAIKALKSNSSSETTAKIIWKAWRENNETYLSITDNGSGASQEQFKALYNENEVVGIKTGLGLHLIRDLAKSINCKITVNTNVTGTTFILQLPNN